MLLTNPRKYNSWVCLYISIALPWKGPIEQAKIISQRGDILNNHNLSLWNLNGMSKNDPRHILFIYFFPYETVFRGMHWGQNTKLVMKSSGTSLKIKFGHSFHKLSPVGSPSRLLFLSSGTAHLRVLPCSCLLFCWINIYKWFYLIILI